jgi:hypothetical protein
MQEKNACNNWEKTMGTTQLPFSLSTSRNTKLSCVFGKKMAQLHAKTQDVQQS